MRRFVVMTSIQPPTHAVRQLARQRDWSIVVVGDRKTPKDWACEGITYLDVEAQARLGFATVGELPFGHYARKNIGYLYAMQHGADVVFETDDDNALLREDLPVGLVQQRVPVVSTDEGFVNVYRLYTDRKVWPRGFPLDLIRSQAPILQQLAEVSAPVHQGLANGDPDVDAIYRLVDGSLLDFKGDGCFALATGSHCPFNSQATFWFPQAYWAMLLPASVPMRVTDIWRGYVAQALLAKYGHSVLFTGPLMRQDRNVHDLMRDFVEELPFYRDARRFVELADGVAHNLDPLDTLVDCYEVLLRAGLIERSDVSLAQAWRADLRAMGNR